MVGATGKREEKRAGRGIRHAGESGGLIYEEISGDCDRQL